VGQKISQVYREAAKEFANRVNLALYNQIDSIVLYGLVARGEARRDSDIDILIVSLEPRETDNKIEKICSDFTYECDFSFFISLVHFSRSEFYKLIELRSPLINDVLREGVILYDNDTFSRVHQQLLAVSG